VTAPRIVVAGGHSAGHIEPMMNFADALRRLVPTAEITALGTVRGLDTTLIPARSGQPAGGPDDDAGVHRRAEGPTGSRHRHRNPAAAGDDRLDRPALRDTARQRFGLRPDGRY